MVYEQTQDPIEVDSENQQDLPLHQQIVDLNQGILLELGEKPSTSWKILDFGCGSGRHVYEYRRRGYDCMGFDKVNCVSLRDPGDAQHFLFSEGDGIYHIPCSVASFDFIFSTSVFEHVLDHEDALREIHQALKPGGVSLHIFPSRYRLIEPHILIPWGGLFHSRMYFYFWALMGIRNQFQKGKSAHEVAVINTTYSQTGICYPRYAELVEQAQEYFSTVRFVEKAFLRHSKGRTARLYPLVNKISLLEGFYRAFHTCVLFLKKGEPSRP